MFKGDEIVTLPNVALMPSLAIRLQVPLSNRRTSNMIGGRPRVHVIAYSPESGNVDLNLFRPLSS